MVKTICPKKSFAKNFGKNVGQKKICWYKQFIPKQLVTMNVARICYKICKCFLNKCIVLMFIEINYVAINSE